MKNYWGVRKEMKEAGWRRADRSSSVGTTERWCPPGDDFGHFLLFESARRRYLREKKQKGAGGSK